MLYTLALLAALCANATANILMKASASLETSGFTQYASVRFLAGIACFVLALFLYQLALKRWDLSSAYPLMTGGGLVLIALASWFLFQETLSPLRLTGMSLIAAGAILVTR